MVGTPGSAATRRTSCSTTPSPRSASACYGCASRLAAARLDPSVTDQNDPRPVDPGLGRFNPANGPPYSAEFQRHYRGARRARNERITDWVLGELARLAGTRCRERLFTQRRLQEWPGPGLARADWVLRSWPVSARF